MGRNRFALNYAGVWREAFGLPDITPDNGIVAYGYASEYGRIGIYGHVVLDDWMSRTADRLAFLIIAEALCTECNSLIYTDVGSNDCRGLCRSNRRSGLPDGCRFLFPNGPFP